MRKFKVIDKASEEQVFVIIKGISIIVGKVHDLSYERLKVLFKGKSPPEESLSENTNSLEMREHELRNSLKRFPAQKGTSRKSLFQVHLLRCNTQKSLELTWKKACLSLLSDKHHDSNKSWMKRLISNESS